MQTFVEEGDEYKPAVSRKSSREAGLAVVPPQRRPSAGLQVERWYPMWGMVITLACTAFFRAHTSIFDWDRQADFLTKVVDIAAGFTTYALTVITVLPALDDRKAVQLLRTRGVFTFFTRYLGAALYASAWLLIYGLGLKFSFYHVALHKAFWAPTASSLWWASCIYAILSLFRASRLLLEILRSQ